MKLSTGLFATGLDMHWVHRGGHVELQRRGEVVWHSHKAHNKWYPSWDYPSLNWIAKMINAYLCMSIKDLRAGKKPYFRAGWYDKDGSSCSTLYSILISCDRRLGKNWQSTRLFTENDRHVRNIIGERL